MSRAPFILIDGKPYRWKDILELRRAQLAAAGSRPRRLFWASAFMSICAEGRGRDARSFPRSRLRRVDANRPRRYRPPGAKNARRAPSWS
jgi:hypothetical protein